MNLIPVTGTSDIKNYRSQDKLLELASMVKDESGRAFLKRYIPIASYTFPGASMSQSIRIAGEISDSELAIDSGTYFMDLPKESKNKVTLSETVPIRQKFVDILQFIYKLDKKEETITKDEVGMGWNMVKGEPIIITKEDVTNTIYSSDKTKVIKKAVPLEAVTATKIIINDSSYKNLNFRYETLRNNLVYHTMSLVKNTGVNESRISQEINLLAEKMPYKFTISEVQSADYRIAPVEEPDTLYTLDEFLNKKNIMNPNARLKYKAALTIRIINDYIHPKIANNVLKYFNMLLANLPDNFINRNNIVLMRDKWMRIAAQFEHRKGSYIPHVYKEDVLKEILELISAYNLVKEEKEFTEHKDILKEAKRRLETASNDFLDKVKKNMIHYNATGGLVYGWELKRKIPDWAAKRIYNRRL